MSFFADPGLGWQPALLNLPVTSENSLWTGTTGRGEVRVGASTLHLEADSVVDFSLVGDDLTRATLQRGSLAIRVRAAGQPESLQVQACAGRAVFESAGRFRLDASASGECRLTAFDGAASFEFAARRFIVDRGRALVLSTPSTEPRFDAAGETSVDLWAQARNQPLDAAYARVVREETLSTYMTGYEDLDANGIWAADAEYGNIWSPSGTVEDWAPYRYGHWVWVAPWGWTWIDDAAWGFAPFHYGRWVFLRARWWWWPGPRAMRPVYAPALVSWYGHPGWKTHAVFGPTVTWCPLAPREHFIPYYAHGNGYLHRINHVDNTVVVAPPRVYANQRGGQSTMKQLHPAPLPALHRPQPLVSPRDRPQDRPRIASTPPAGPERTGRNANEPARVTPTAPVPVNTNTAPPAPVDRGHGRQSEPARTTPSILTPVIVSEPIRTLPAAPIPTGTMAPTPRVQLLAPRVNPVPAPAPPLVTVRPAPRIENRVPPVAPHPPASTPANPAPAHNEKHPANETPRAEGHGVHP